MPKLAHIVLSSGLCAFTIFHEYRIGRNSEAMMLKCFARGFGHRSVIKYGWVCGKGALFNNW